MAELLASGSLPILVVFLILYSLPLMIVFIGMALLQWHSVGVLRELIRTAQLTPPPVPSTGHHVPPAPPTPPVSIPDGGPVAPPVPPAPPTPPQPGPVVLTRQAWPHEAVPASLDAFYGNPRGINGASTAWVAANVTKFTFPWKVNGSQQTFDCHVRVKASLDRVLAWCWDHVGHDQAKINAAHLNEFDGSFVYRPNVNHPSTLSLHSYAIAFDFAAAENPNGKPWVNDGRMLPRWFVDAFLAEGWSWGGDFGGTKDAMHFQATYNTHPDGAPQDQPHGAALDVSVPNGKQVGITATFFGGQTSAYGGPIHDDQYGVALPFHFTGTRKKVRVTGRSSGVSIDCDIVDVGPWNIKDAYWETGSRPQAESGTDMTGRHTNKAGIDLTAAAANKVAINGKGLVDWEFIG